MVDYDRIEPETEAHRTEKAVKELVRNAALPFPEGVVRVMVEPRVRHEPCTQLLTSMLVHLLLRMKGVVRSVQLVGIEDVQRHPAVPLGGEMLAESLRHLGHSLNGPASTFRSTLAPPGAQSAPALTVAIGHREGDVVLGADAWRALLGSYSSDARWSDVCPLGPYMAATIGAAEVFKRLIATNFGWNEGSFLEDLAFSLLNYGVDAEAASGPDVSGIELQEIALAGAGAGGTAVLYTLGSFSHLTGELLVAEPGYFKASNLNRYLLSTYREVQGGASKLESAVRFLEWCAPELQVRGLPVEWTDVPDRRWGLVMCTVDTPEARWQVQRSDPETILEGGVMLGTLYAVLRVVPGGWCLECKHPRDPDVTWKKRAARWGVSVDTVKDWHANRRPVSRADLERLAQVQGRPAADFAALEGTPFDEVPERTECGETPLFLSVPSQAPVLPFATTAAGVAIAAEVVKEVGGVGEKLSNYFTHDLRHRPKGRLQAFRPSRAGCHAAVHARGQRGVQRPRP